MITVYSGKFSCTVCNQDFVSNYPDIEGALHEQNHKLNEILERLR